MATNATQPENSAGTKCETHETEDLTDWCCDCQHAICPTCCEMPGVHQDHKTERLLGMFTEKREIIQKFIDSVKKFDLSELQKVIQSIDDNREENSQTLETMLSEVCSLKGDIETLKSGNETLLNNHKIELEKLKEVEGLKKQIPVYTEILSSGSYIQIYKTESVIKESKLSLDPSPLYMPMFYPRAAISDYLSVALSRLAIPGFRKCGRSECKICEYTETKHYFKSSVDLKTYRIRHTLSCRSTNVIYLITCARCKKQYVGETVRTLEVRINEHVKQDKFVVDKHFKEQNGHVSKDMQVIAIDQNKQWNKTERCEKEEYWIRTLQTKKHGLNVKL